MLYYDLFVFGSFRPFLDGRPIEVVAVSELDTEQTRVVARWCLASEVTEHKKHK